MITENQRKEITSKHEEKYEKLAQEIGINKLKNIIEITGLTIDSPLKEFDKAIKLVNKRLTLAQNTCLLKHVIKFH